MSAEGIPAGPRPAVPPVGPATAPTTDAPERAIGETRVRPAVAALLCACFVAIIGGVPATELLGGEAGGREAWRSFLGGLAPRVVTELRGEGFFAANRLLLGEMSRFEGRLEEESVLVATVAPHARALLLAYLGIAGPEVYPGRDGWLFYRPDVEHVTGPGFLEPAVLTARARGGDAWAVAPAPDPRPALERFRDDLAARGIALVVMPTPVKPAIHPERLARRAGTTSRPLANPSTAVLATELEAAGISVFDPSELLAGEETADSYLVGDTHWRPEAMERVAAALADRLAEAVPLGERQRAVWWRRPVSVEGSGDTARILELSSWGQHLLPRQRVEVQQVTAPDGTLWRPVPGAPVLLLGDSFTNVFSQADLGWGAGAGLAEQLAYHLEAPVDRIAINAGGAYASREELARALARGEERLTGTQVVVLQFAVRELSFGDWRVIPLSE